LSKKNIYPGAKSKKKMQILSGPGKEFEKAPSATPAFFCHSRESGNPLEIFVNPDSIRTTPAPLEVRRQLLTGSEEISRS